jgi:hypothetical protein
VNEQDLKSRYERWAADTLLGALGGKAQFERHGNDRTEPDIIYRLPTQRSLGVEVTTAYYSEEHAHDIWLNAVSLEDVFEGFQRPVGVVENPDELIVARIQQQINDKVDNTYSGTYETWLCIVEQAPLTDEGSLKQHLSNLAIPENDFAGIYLLRKGLVGAHYYAIKLQ